MKSVQEQFNYRVWSAFSRLVEKRYHRNIAFSPAMSAEDFGKEYILTTNGDLILPLYAGEHFLGAIRVKQGGTLSNDERQAIQKMFSKVGSALLDASDSLNRMESNEGQETKKYTCNLIGGGHELRHKIATNLHEVLGSWSLVPWTDSGIAHWNNEDMEDLANICIYVRDILELSPQERQQLLTLRKLPSALRPHLMIGSFESLNQYVDDQLLDPEFAILFSETTIFTEQMPKDYLRLKEVLEMLVGDENRPAPVEQIFS